MYTQVGARKDRSACLPGENPHRINGFGGYCKGISSLVDLVGVRYVGRLRQRRAHRDSAGESDTWASWRLCVQV